MRRDDPDDPFDDIFREIERMMNEMMGGAFETNVEIGGGQAGFGSHTHVDVQETDEEVRVVADLPGVDQDDIELTCDGEVLTIGASSDHRDYDERIQLPASVDEHSASATYNNGVLEVVMERDDGSTSIDVR